MLGQKGKDTLRTLAAEVAEIAADPIQRETIALWKDLNNLQPRRPMVMIDQIPWHEMNVEDELTLTCEDPFWQEVELKLRREIYRWRHMRVDYVVEPFVNIPKAFHSSGFGIAIKEDRLQSDPSNGVVSHHYMDQLADEADVDKIVTPTITLDEDTTAQREAQAHEIFDGTLTVRMQGVFPAYAPWDILSMWRGVEPILYDMVDRPEHIARMVDRLTEARLGELDQLEALGLLGTGQSWIHCTGAFTDELDSTMPPTRAANLWTHGMSQMFSTVSPAMHEEYEGPYLTRWFSRFGIAYYGCCEPLHLKIDMIRKLPKVRKISMSPWTDQDIGAASIGSDYVFSRKPSPALLAVDDWNPEAVERDLRETIEVCSRHGCALELILKDISTARYEPERLWQWADIAMGLVRA